MKYNSTSDFFTELNSGDKWSAGVSFNRTNALPLDSKSVFESEEVALAYARATDNTAYPGQIISVADGDDQKVYVISADSSDPLKAITGSEGCWVGTGFAPTGGTPTSRTSIGLYKVMEGELSYDADLSIRALITTAYSQYSQHSIMTFNIRLNSSDKQFRIYQFGTLFKTPGNASNNCQLDNDFCIAYHVDESKSKAIWELYMYIPPTGWLVRKFSILDATTRTSTYSPKYKLVKKHVNESVRDSENNRVIIRESDRIRANATSDGNGGYTISTGDYLIEVSGTTFDDYLNGRIGAGKLTGYQYSTSLPLILGNTEVTSGLNVGGVTHLNDNVGVKGKLNSTVLSDAMNNSPACWAIYQPEGNNESSMVFRGKKQKAEGLISPNAISLHNKKDDLTVLSSGYTDEYPGLYCTKEGRVVITRSSNLGSITSLNPALVITNAGYDKTKSTSNEPALAILFDNNEIQSIKNYSPHRWSSESSLSATETFNFEGQGTKTSGTHTLLLNKLGGNVTIGNAGAVGCLNVNSKNLEQVTNTSQANISAKFAGSLRLPVIGSSWASSTEGGAGLIYDSRSQMDTTAGAAHFYPWISDLGLISLGVFKGGGIYELVFNFNKDPDNRNQLVWDMQNNKLSCGSYNATSDARLKENFQEFKPEKSILDLPTYKFDFINGAKNQIGCKAQDLQEICPEIVDEGSDGMLSIQESKIVYLLLDEIKKLRKEVDELKRQ